MSVTATPTAAAQRIEVDDAVAPPPAGYVTVESVVAKHMESPGRAAAIARARARLAKVADAGQVTLRSLRLARGLSQMALSRMIATSQPHIARLEKGRENVSLAVMRKLCVALAVDMNTLNEALLTAEQVGQPVGEP